MTIFIPPPSLPPASPSLALLGATRLDSPLMLRWPLLLIGITVAIYWARVLRMAAKARRRTGRSANFLPSEPVGRLVRIVWFPVIVIWVAYPFLAAANAHLPSSVRPVFYSPWLSWPMAAIVVAGFLLTRHCWKTMGRAWRMGIDPAEQNTLVANGPFARVRHPIYALSAMMMLATMAAAPAPLMLIAGGLHIILLAWEAHREEAHLLRVHGDAYRAYQRQTARFVPKLGRAPGRG